MPITMYPRNRRTREGNGNYSIPVFDYNQMLALRTGCDPKQAAPTCTVPRGTIIERFWCRARLAQALDFFGQLLEASLLCRIGHA